MSPVQYSIDIISFELPSLVFVEHYVPHTGFGRLKCLFIIGVDVLLREKSSPFQFKLFLDY